VKVSITEVTACSVVRLWKGGGRAPTQDPLDESRYGCVGGGIIRSMDWRHAENKITGKCEVEVGSKPSKSGCCCSNCDSTSDRAADQRIYGVLGGDRQRQQVAKAHSHRTKQINNKIACQLYLDIPTHAHNSSHAMQMPYDVCCAWNLTDARRGSIPNQARHCVPHSI
jgi:hypothetical protein